MRPYAIQKDVFVMSLPTLLSFHYPNARDQQSRSGRYGTEQHSLSPLAQASSCGRTVLQLHLYLTKTKRMSLCNVDDVSALDVHCIATTIMLVRSRAFQTVKG
jgi:hypothetical protein